MKTIIPLLFLVPPLLAGCGDTSADNPGTEPISSGTLRVEEFEGERRDGETFRIRQTLRGDSLILFESWQDGKFVRIYHLDGRPIWGEADETGDGHLDTINVWAPDGTVVEAFTRHESGTVAPFSDEELEGLLALNAAADERKRQILDDARRAIDEEGADPES